MPCRRSWHGEKLTDSGCRINFLWNQKEKASNRERSKTSKVNTFRERCLSRSLGDLEQKLSLEKYKNFSLQSKNERKKSNYVESL